jgi:hypothetical protein
VGYSYQNLRFSHKFAFFLRALRIIFLRDVMPYRLAGVSSVSEEPAASIFRVPWTAGSSKILVNTDQTSSVIAHEAVIFIFTRRASNLSQFKRSNPLDLVALFCHLHDAVLMYTRAWMGFKYTPYK